MRSNGRARSRTSIGANYREAFRARSKAEFIAKCGDSLREIEESAYSLELLVESGVISVEKLAPLRQECEELTAIFVYHPEASEDLLILNCYVLLLPSSLFRFLESAVKKAKP